MGKTHNLTHCRRSLFATVENSMTYGMGSRACLLSRTGYDVKRGDGPRQLELKQEARDAPVDQGPDRLARLRR
jgi:hypothetical protein